LEGKRPPLPPECPPSYAFLIQKCWDQDPAKRPTFKDVKLMLHTVKLELSKVDRRLTKIQSSSAVMLPQLPAPPVQNDSPATSLSDSANSANTTSGTESNPSSGPASQNPSPRVSSDSVQPPPSASSSATPDIGVTAFSLLQTLGKKQQQQQQQQQQQNQNT